LNLITSTPRLLLLLLPSEAAAAALRFGRRLCHLPVWAPLLPIRLQLFEMAMNRILYDNRNHVRLVASGQISQEVRCRPPCTSCVPSFTQAAVQAFPEEASEDQREENPRPCRYQKKWISEVEISGRSIQGGNP